MAEPNNDLSEVMQRIRNLERGRNGASRRTHHVESDDLPVEENDEHQKDATTNLIGSHPTVKPQYPPIDSVVSKGKTPEQKGARPCRYCGSGKHWDYDCPKGDYQKKKSQFKKGKFKTKFSKNFKQKAKAKAHYAGIDHEAYAAFVEYDQAYYSEMETSDEEPSDSEHLSGSEAENAEDFQ
jgi:hypothetical protein